MRSYFQESFRVIPSTQPLKSPSPDFKGKTVIAPTQSPQNEQIKKYYFERTPPNNRIDKKQIWQKYNTLPCREEQRFLNIQMQADNRYFKDSSGLKGKQQHLGGYAQYSSAQDPHSYTPDSIKESKYYVQPTTPLKKEKEERLMKQVEEKNTIISQLKEMIKELTQDGKYLKPSKSSFLWEDYENMKNEVKILTIENQKLVQVLQKIKEKNERLKTQARNYETNRKECSEQEDQEYNNEQKNLSFRASQIHSVKVSAVHSEPGKIKENHNKNSVQSANDYVELEKQLIQLKEQMQEQQKQIKKKQAEYEKQIDELIKSHKSLALECRMFESQKQRYSRQNQSLINLLKLKQKEKDTGYYSYVQSQDKSKPSRQTTAEKYMQNVNPNHMNRQLSEGRFTIQKIKEQYEENLKQYKQNVYNQVENMFETLGNALEEVNQKVNQLEERLAEVEQVKFELLRRLKQGCKHVQSQYEEEEERGKKSAIYIQEAPSSSCVTASHKRSREDLSMILQESRRDNERLELEVSRLRKQLENYKQTARLYQNQVVQGQVVQSGSQLQEQNQLRQKIKQLEMKVTMLKVQKQQKQQELLQFECQVMKSEENRLAQRQLNNQISEKKSESKNIQENEKQLVGEEEFKQLQQAFEKKEQEVSDLRQKLTQMKSCLESRQKQLFGEIEKLQDIIEKTQREYNQTMGDHQTVKKAMEETLQQKNQQIQFLQCQLSQKQQTFQQTEQLKTQNQELQNQIKLITLEKNDIMTELQQLELKLQAEAQRVQQYKQQSIYNKEKNQQNIYQIQSLREKLTKHQEILQVLRKKLQDYLSNIKNSQSIEQLITAEIELKQEEIQNSQQLLRESLESIKAFEAERASRQQQVITLKQQIILLKGQITQLEQCINLYKKQLDLYRNKAKKQSDGSESNDQDLNIIKGKHKINQDKKVQGNTQELLKQHRGRNVREHLHELLQEERNKINEMVEIINSMQGQIRHV